MRYSSIDVVLTAACFAIQPGRSDIIATAAAALSVSPAFGIRDREWDGTGRRDLSWRLPPPARDLTSDPSLPVQDSATRTAPGALAGGRAGALFIRRRGFSPVPTSVILFLVKSLPPPLFAAALCVLASRLRSRRLIGLPPLIKSAYLCGPSGSQSKIIVSIIGP